MRYDDCYKKGTPAEIYCAGSRSYHFEWDDGRQFTACETHSGVDGTQQLKRIPCRTD